MVGATAILWSIWKPHNAVCFQNKIPSEPNNPIALILSVCHWLNFWTLMKKEEVDQGILLEQVAAEVFNAK